MQEPNSQDAERLRHLADTLDCLTEQDFKLLADVTSGTAEAWRKRGQGPNYIRVGNRIFYPRHAVADYLKTCTRARQQSTKAVFL